MIDYKYNPNALKFHSYIVNKNISTTELETLLNNCNESDIQCLNSGRNEDYIYDLYYYGNFSFENIILILNKKLRYSTCGIYNILENLELSNIKKILDTTNLIYKVVWQLSYERGGVQSFSDELITELISRISPSKIQFEIENNKGYYASETLRILNNEQKRRREIAYYKSLPGEKGEYTRQSSNYDWFRATGYR